MRIPLLLATTATFLTGCRESETSLQVTETRRLTFHDQAYPGDFKDRPPLEWRRLPGTQFRLINYVTGKDESVEIVMGETQGKVLDNANRWLGQFGLTPLQTVEYLGKTSFLGRDAYLVEGSGTYNPGMGQPPQPGYAMIGVIRDHPSNLVTLKMIGPAEEVEAQRAALYQYMKDFELVDDHVIKEPRDQKDQKEESE